MDTKFFVVKLEAKRTRKIQVWTRFIELWIGTSDSCEVVNEPSGSMKDG
jgi:hypothetical protein